MKEKLFALFVAGFMSLTGTDAQAVTVSTGEWVLFNFDLTGETPSPPYATGDFQENLVVHSDIEGWWEIFGGSDGSGGVIFEFGAEGGPLSSQYLEGWSDGVFSARLKIYGGSVDTDPCFIGRKASTAPGALETSCTEPSGYTTGTLPEPGTLALLGLGLAGLGLSRRRKVN